MATFEKVGECLYRYTPTGTYYARIWIGGKEVRRSLETTDRALAKRRLVDKRNELSRVDLTAGKCSLSEMCDRYLATVQNQKPKTVRRKNDIALRLKADFPGGAGLDVRKVLTSQIGRWLASYSFGAASFNLYLDFVRAVFALAIHDKLRSDSPVEGIDRKTGDTPIRETPSPEEFRAIVAEIRAQVFSAEAADSGDFVEFIGLAGLGQAEASSLRWKDIEWERNRIVTFRHKTSTGFAVPLFPQLRPFLEKLRESRGEGARGDALVFKVKDAKKALLAACKRLGLPAYSHRAFRRMFVTSALEKGINPKVIASWQGHSPKDGGRLILSTYSHLTNAHSDAMAKLME